MQNSLYNNTYQIVQTPDHVLIDVEMNHDARDHSAGEGQVRGKAHDQCDPALVRGFGRLV